MIYLVRHGESTANAEGKYQGQTYDTHLSAFGKKQVKKIASYFKDKKVADVYVSPLTRTKETAQIVSSAVGKPYQLEPLLLETDHGDWAGKEKEWIFKHYPEFVETWQNNPKHVSFPNGEDFLDVVERAKDVLKAHPGRDRDIVFISHDNTIRAILSVAEGREINKMWDYPLENASISILTPHDDRYELREVVVEHLNGLRSEVDTQAL